MKKFAILCISILILNFLMIDYADCVSSDNFKVSTNISRNEWVSIGISLGVVLGGGLIYWCLEEPDRAPDPFSYIPAETKREDWYILDRAHVIRNENFFSKDYIILKESWKEVLMLLQIGDKTPAEFIVSRSNVFLIHLSKFKQISS